MTTLAELAALLDAATGPIHELRGPVDAVYAALVAASPRRMK